MARRGIEPMAEEHVNVTPLIDVVMCLIIFFMVCGRLAKDEREGGSLAVPLASQGREINDQRGRLIINLVPDEKSLPPGLDPNNAADKEAIAEARARSRPQIYVRGKTIPPDQLWTILSTESKLDRDVKVMIRADQKLSYEYVAPILVDCARANIKSVNFATVSRP